MPRGGYIPGCIERARRMGKANIKYPPQCRYWYYRLRSWYKITPEQWNEMVLRSNGRCDICSKQFTNVQQGINVDHDHKTYKIRGLLCARCNTLLAGLEDNLFRIMAEKYLLMRGH